MDEYYLLGNSGLRVSRMALGTMTWGTAWPMGADKETCRKIFRAYCEAGGNFIDTADKYHEGMSEEWLGEFMEEAGNREDLVVATKFSLPRASKATVRKTAAGAGAGTATEDVPDLGEEGAVFTPNRAGNSRKNMRSALEDSLKRLRTSYVDILYLHFYDFTTTAEEVMRTFNDLVSAGKVMYPAISDAPAWFVAECNMLAKVRGWAPLICGQYRFSLVDRTIERNVLSYAKSRPFPIVPWAVLGGGKLTGKYTREKAAPEDSARASSWGVTLTEQEFTIVDVLLEVAKECDAHPAQVAVAWALAQRGVGPVLVGCRTLSQFESNVKGVSLKLTDDQLGRLSEVSKVDLGFPLNFIGESVDDCPWIKPAGVVKRL